MDAPHFLKKDWVLTQEAFDKLLACLNPDRETAAREYESIRESLITFFKCRGSCSPEDHADETINRVARRLGEGKQIYALSPGNYFYGVARNILKEYWEAPDRLPYQLGKSPAPGELEANIDESLEQGRKQAEFEKKLECLEHCLQQLSQANRRLIVKYYLGESSVKIKNRKRLAQQLGISPNALRNKALRLREKLEDCVCGCLKHTL